MSRDWEGICGGGGMACSCCAETGGEFAGLSRGHVLLDSVAAVVVGVLAEEVSVVGDDFGDAGRAVGGVGTGGAVGGDVQLVLL